MYRYGASLVAQTVKRLPAMKETWVQPLGQEDPWRRKWQPTPVFLIGKSHGGKSRGAWQATVHGVAKGWTQLNNNNTCFVLFYKTWGL